MKALVTSLNDDGTRKKDMVTNWPEPPAPVGAQFKTRVLYTGITNGSERNDLARGNYAHSDEALPAPWGYQNVGEVIETGPDVQSIKPGDIVYMSQDHLEYCLNDENGSLYVKIPDGINTAHTALFGMASVAMRTCRNAEIKMGDTVLVVGAGFIGQMAAQYVNVMGGRATICDINENRLEIARKIGAAECVVNTSGDGWKESIEDGSFRVVIDVAGVPGMEDQMINALEHRGTLLFIAGRFKIEYTFNFGQMREIVIKQNSHFDNDDLANVCRLVSRKQVDLEPMVQDIIPVSKAKEAYDKLRDTPEKMFGTIFDWNA